MKSNFMDIGLWMEFLFIIILPVHFKSRKEKRAVSVKFSSVIHLTVDNYYLRGFGFISISV